MSIKFKTFSTFSHKKISLGAKLAYNFPIINIVNCDNLNEASMFTFNTFLQDIIIRFSQWKKARKRNKMNISWDETNTDIISDGIINNTVIPKLKEKYFRIIKVCMSTRIAQNTTLHIIQNYS